MCPGSENQQLSRQPASERTPAANPHNPPASAGRVGNARAVINVASTMIGAPIAIGHVTHSDQYCQRRSTGTIDPLVTPVTMAIPTRTSAVNVVASRSAPRDALRPGTASRNPRASRPSPASDWSAVSPHVTMGA